MTESKKITNPFPGLRPFESDEYRLFFGREGQSDALISRLQRSRFLAVVGTSGSGKSSLVRAGLLPALRGGMMAGAGSGWRIAIMRPGSDPIGNLALALAKEEVLLKAGGGLPQAEVEAIIDASLRRGALGLVEVARQAQLAEHEKLLVVVDQFEELFRFRAARGASSTRDDASAFVKLLIEASQQREISIYVVPTMRSDFLGDCAQFQGLPEAINDGQYLIPRMTRDERRFAITGPVGVTRGKITEPLVNRLMNDVGDNPDQLPILQHALMRTWNYWAAHRRNGDPIGLEHYEAIGTMSDALSLHADEAYEQLPEHLRHVCEILFKTLTERGADNREIRRPTRLKDICEIAGASVADVIAVIDVFRDVGCSFLMPPVGVELKPETVIDISHESLIRNWDRLQKWVNEEAQSARIYRRLAEAAVLHREGSEGLLQDPGLQTALDWRDKWMPNAAWAARYHSEFDAAVGYLEKSGVARDARSAAEREREQERRELETSRAFGERQARSARRMRWLTAGMGFMFLLSLVTAGYAMVQSNRASSEQAKAEKSAKVAEVEKEKAEKSAHQAKQAQVIAEQERTKAEQEKAKADLLAEDLKEEKKKTDTALEAQKLATVRANEQTAIAAENLKKAEVAQREVTAALNRGELLRRGVEAFRRDNFNEALLSYERLRAELTALQPGAARAAADLKSEQVKQYAADLGWTLSNIGTTHLRTKDFAAAADAYEKALVVFAQVLPKDSGDPILFDTYDGLAQSYQELAKNRRHQPGEISLQADFTKAEDFYRRALALKEQMKSQPSEIAAAHLKLARLYVEAGKPGSAEDNFKSAIELRRVGKESGDLDRSERAALVSAFRELGEFYQEQAGGFDEAIKVFNEMIVVQEDVNIDELVDLGPELAKSYSDLARVYLAGRDEAKRDAAKAEAALRTANLLQRTTLKLRQIRNTRDPVKGSRIVIELIADLDDLGDAYSKLGKFPDAEAIYLQAFEYRETTAEVWKSYDKLMRLYRENKKPAKAEEYKDLLLAAARDNAEVLMQLGALHADDPYDPKKPSESEQYYKDALAIYRSKNDWNKENVILYRLSRLYLKHKRAPERAKALRERVDTMARYFKQLVELNTLPEPKNPALLVSEYLYAVNALAYGNQNKLEAEIHYRQALEMFYYITRNIRDEKVLDLYATTLEDYRRLLIKLGKQAEAAKFAGKIPAMREKAAQSREERKPDTDAAQYAPSQSGPTSP